MDGDRGDVRGQGSRFTQAIGDAKPGAIVAPQRIAVADDHTASGAIGRILNGNGTGQGSLSLWVEWLT